MSKKKSTSTEKPVSIGSENPNPVTFISDPFQGLPTMDAEEMDSEETELSPLDTDQLQNLSEAMAKEENKIQEDWKEREELLNEDAAALLAAQIAEDEALKAQIAKEDAALEEEIEDQTQVLDLEEAEACVETLLFLSDKPISVKKLEEYLEPHMSKKLMKEAIETLKARYESPRHGFELLEVAGGLQFRTKPGKAFLSKKLAKIQTQRLSRGAMESLAIIAYKQPILKDEIDRIRGVDSSHFIRTLMERKLVEMQGRSELPGRPIVYGTTNEFLSLFNIASMNDLPPLREIEQMVPTSEIGAEDNPVVREMKSLISKMKDTSDQLGYKPEEDEIFLNEMKEKILSTTITTPYLEEQARLDKASKEAVPHDNSTSGL